MRLRQSDLSTLDQQSLQQIKHPNQNNNLNGSIVYHLQNGKFQTQWNILTEEQYKRSKNCVQELEKFLEIMEGISPILGLVNKFDMRPEAFIKKVTKKSQGLQFIQKCVLPVINQKIQPYQGVSNYNTQLIKKELCQSILKLKTQLINKNLKFFQLNQDFDMINKDSMNGSSKSQTNIRMQLIQEEMAKFKQEMIKSKEEMTKFKQQFIKLQKRVSVIEDKLENLNNKVDNLEKLFIDEFKEIKSTLNLILHFQRSQMNSFNMNH